MDIHEQMPDPWRDYHPGRVGAVAVAASLRYSSVRIGPVGVDTNGTGYAWVYASVVGDLT